VTEKITIILGDQSGPLKDFFCKTGPECLIYKGIRFVRGIPKAKGFYGFLAEAPLFEVVKSGYLALLRVKKLVFVKLPGKFKDFVDGFPLTFCQYGFRICLGFFQLDPIFAGKVPNGLRIIISFVLHDKFDGIPAFATAKTLKYVPGRRN
jgi:hypothetical protein